MVVKFVINNEIKFLNEYIYSLEDLFKIRNFIINIDGEIKQYRLDFVDMAYDDLCKGKINTICDDIFYLAHLKEL